MEITFNATFRKQYEKANVKIKKAFQQRLKTFKTNPYNPLLRNHQLVGESKMYRSITITGDWRALYRENDSVIIFTALGTHSQLYG